MRAGGQILSEIMFAAINFVSPNQSLQEINRFIEKAISAKKVSPSFKTVRDYCWASCLNLNEGVVHGIPHPDIKVKAGDYLSIDIGVFHQGYHTDMAYTLKVAGSGSTDKFLSTGKEALNKAIGVVRAGARVGSISQQIQQTIQRAGYTCVESLTGHGVGETLHQEPFIPSVLNSPLEETPLIATGQALAIEVIYTQGKDDLVTDVDGWTIRTRDGKISALFEKTVFVDDYQAEVLTPFFWEENVQKGK
jgi:methionyl aminopeptidase